MLMALNAAQGACYELDSSWTPEWPSLTGYWPLNGTIGGLANGTSVTARVGTNGTIVGSSAAYIAGRINQGLSFNWSTSNTALDIGDGSQYDYGLSNFSGALWIKFPTGTANPQWSIGKGNAYASGGTAGTGGGWGIAHYTTATTFAPTLFLSDGANYQQINFCTVSRGVWIHLAFVVDRTNSKATTFVNGAQCNQGVISGLQSMSYPSASGSYYHLSIGRGASSWYNGSIDDVAIWSTTLTRNEIKMIYDQQSCGMN